jgi:hypothetical protein
MTIYKWQKIQWQNKNDRKTDNTMTKIKMKERQTIQRSFCHFYFVFVLSVLLSFLFCHCIVCPSVICILSLYCLSFCDFYFGHCFVFPSVIFILVIVLSVLLSFLFWSLYCLSFCHFYFGHCIVCLSVIFILSLYCLSFVYCLCFVPK